MCDCKPSRIVDFLAFNMGIAESKSLVSQDLGFNSLVKGQQLFRRVENQCLGQEIQKNVNISAWASPEH